MDTAVFFSLRWRLEGVLPPWTDAVLVGDVLRRALIGGAGEIAGRDRVPSAISGHEDGGPEDGSRLPYLSEDADGDGKLDHLLIHCPQGLPPLALAAAARLDRLWAGGEGAWHLREPRAPTAGESDGVLLGTARAWVSASPCWSPLFWRPNRPPLAMFTTLCRHAALPRPEAVEPLPPLAGERLDWRLTFPQPVTGPVVLGALRHYGLGSFAPAADQEPQARLSPSDNP